MYKIRFVDYPMYILHCHCSHVVDILLLNFQLMLKEESHSATQWWLKIGQHCCNENQLFQKMEQIVINNTIQ